MFSVAKIICLLIIIKIETGTKLIKARNKRSRRKKHQDTFTTQGR